MTGGNIVVTLSGPGAPAGKLADAEIHFTEGILAGLKLVGFTVWDARDGDNPGVTFPARQYRVNGERRHYSLLRVKNSEFEAADKLRQEIVEAYAAIVGV